VENVKKPAVALTAPANSAIKKGGLLRLNETMKKVKKTPVPETAEE